MPRRLTVLLTALLLGCPSAAAAQAPDEPGRSHRCNAMELIMRGGAVAGVREYEPIGAITRPRRFGSNAVLWVSLRRLGCDAFRDLITTVLPAADEAVALDAAGWRIERVDPLKIDGVKLHQVWARLGRLRAIYVRRGGRLKSSSAIWRAAQTVGFPRSVLTCTSAFILHLPAPSGMHVGLTAGHCSDYGTPPAGGVAETEAPVRFRGSGATQFRDPAGSVLTNSNLQENTPDALIYSLAGLGWASQQIERPGRRPLRVSGVLARERQVDGRTVCFNGYVTRRMRCGEIKGFSDFIGKPAICVKVGSEHGDSGAPVYTRPNRRGEVLAVGLLTRSSIGGLGRDMCFAPIQDVMGVFGAELPLGSFTM